MASSVSSAALLMRPGTASPSVTPVCSASPAVSQYTGSSKPPLPKPVPPSIPSPPSPRPPQLQFVADKETLNNKPQPQQPPQQQQAGDGVPRLVLKSGFRSPPGRNTSVPPLRITSRGRATDSAAASVQSLDQILEHVEKEFQSEVVDRQQQAGPSSSSSGPAGIRDLRSKLASSTQQGAWRSKVDQPRVSIEPGAISTSSLNGIQEPPPSKTEPWKPPIVKPLAPRRAPVDGTTGKSSGLLQRPSPPAKPVPPTRPKPAGPILRDVGAAPQPAGGAARPGVAPARSSAAAPARPVAAPAQSSGAASGPILRDIGAGPRSKAVDPVLATAAVAVPPKFTKAAPVKGKEEWRKKSGSTVEGAKRRVAKKTDDVVIADIDTAEGAVSRRGTGRKSSKASRKAARNEAARAAAPVKVDILEVGKQGLSVTELADKLAVNEGDIVKTLFLKGIAITVTQILDEEAVKLVCKEFDVEVIEAGTVEIKDLAKKDVEFIDENDLDFLQVRAPVVTIMGHVDHGKTSLLDYIRRTKVAASEAGGITQGIGAYRVPVEYGGSQQACVFIDTPGHEAFSAMRARGARVTDITIIVVAADDGVRPQTLEAIAHAKAAKVPMVFALNKIDKEGANPERVKQELANKGILPEEWGGDTPMVQISAVTGENIDTLLETVMLVAEFQELKANARSRARGTVLEASLDKSRGVVATLLVQNGTLRQGDVVLSGESYGKVRALLDDVGSRVEEAGPSSAVQVIGLSRGPVAGSSFEVVTSLDEARERAEEQAELMRVARLAAQAGEGKVTLSSGAPNQGSGLEKHQLNVILKVDAQGSIEPIREALQSLPQNTVSLRFLAQETGDISTSEIDLAIASDAFVVGFNVGLQPGVETQAESEGVKVRVYKVIYDLVDEVRNFMEGLLNVVQEQVPLGKAEVRAVFGSGSSKVAGCIVTEGRLVKGCKLSVIRGGNTIHTGSLDSLRRVKEAAKEVVAGLECGVGIDDFLEWKEGDAIEAYELVEKKRSLEEAEATTAAALVANKA